MTNASSDHPAFGTRPALFGLPSLHDVEAPLVRRALASGECATIEGLAAAVGGALALEHLHGQPWPAEPVDLDAVPPIHRARVLAVVDLVRACGTDDLDGEFHVIVQRLAVRAAARDGVLFRQGSVARTAAALVWLALRGNAELGANPCLAQARDVWQAFGVSSCVDRGRVLYASLDVTPREPVDWLFPDPVEVWLADPHLLHSRARNYVLCELDEILEQFAADHPPTAATVGSVALRARPLVPESAARVRLESGRDVVAVTLLDAADQALVVGLSVPDARHLVRILGDALDGPVRPHRP